MIDYTYDDLYRLTTEETGGAVTTYSYDANGNTVEKSRIGEATAFTYDPANRLIEALSLEGEGLGEGVSQVAYTYDANGIRQSKTVDGDRTNYLVDPNRDYAQVIAETDALGQVDVAYTYGDDLISQSRTAGDYTYHYDGLGTTRVLTDSTSQSTDSYLYRAFGELESQQGSTANSYLFTGEQLDPNLGFYYLRARYMDPNIGRFLSQDTFPGIQNDPVTLHKYLYANVDPVNGIDPSGLVTMGQVSVGLNLQVAFLNTAVLSVGIGIAAGSIDKDGDISLSPSAIGFLLLATIGPSSTALDKFLFKENITADRKKAKSAGEATALSQSTTAVDRFGGKRAVICENQFGRVVPAAVHLKAITIRFTDDYDFGNKKLSPKEVAISIAYNQGWISMLKTQSFDIYDIGRDPGRIARQPISPWYAMERNAVRGYPKHIRYPWP